MNVAVAFVWLLVMQTPEKPAGTVMQDTAYADPAHCFQYAEMLTQTEGHIAAFTCRRFPVDRD